QEHHMGPTAMQTQHEHSASTNRALLASVNHGRPSIAATAKPGEFKGRGVVAASAVSHNASPNGGNRPENAAEMRRSDRPPSARNEHAPSNPSRVNNGANVEHGNKRGNAPHTNNAAQVPHNGPRNENRPRAEEKPHAAPKPEHREGEKPHYR
ncbi:MAG TPA: hypothetical protein VJN42_01850, partial [Candidatus Acidoferrum sp.]|nr:hypothetical protein [Candidatus Acidoferrum sp.]